MQVLHFFPEGLRHPGRVSLLHAVCCLDGAFNDDFAIPHQVFKQSGDAVGIAAMIQSCGCHQHLPPRIGFDLEGQVLKPFVFAELFPGKHEGMLGDNEGESSALPTPNIQKLLHDVVQLPGPLGGAEGIVQGAVEGVELGIDGDVFGDGLIHFFPDGSDFGLQVLPAASAGGHGSKNGGTKGAGLLALADFHGLADDVGVALHEGGVFDAEAAGVDDFVDLDAVVFDALDDGEGSKSGGLDVGAVDLVRFGVQGLAEKQAGEADIDEDGAVAVVPVEREQARGAGFFAFHGFFHGDEFFADAAAVAVGDEMIDEPEEDVADGALAGLDAVVAGQDAAIHDAADAGHVGEGLAGGGDHEVAGAGAEDFHQGAFFDAGTDGTCVGIKGSDGDGDAGF